MGRRKGRRRRRRRGWLDTLPIFTYSGADRGGGERKGGVGEGREGGEGGEEGEEWSVEEEGSWVRDG